MFSDNDNNDVFFEIPLMGRGQDDNLLVLAREHESGLSVTSWMVVDKLGQNRPGRRDVERGGKRFIPSTGQAAEWLWDCGRNSFVMWRGTKPITMEPETRGYGEYALLLHSTRAHARIVRRTRDNIVRIDEIVGVIGWTGLLQLRSGLAFVMIDGKRRSICSATNWTVADLMIDTAPSMWLDVKDDTQWVRDLGEKLADFLKVEWLDRTL